ncbi:Gfo/Idh/MocA family protein [Metabacillus niabensis]|uniref:Gfo/Idh/MocA family protein n=1 Tax=Metabacillus niabensis TaxID=324854 RepID=UPI001CF94DC9|nr:Gfo/Idh/MocA family oxidoreductase [Metabacillus niabensis]
MKQIKLGFIGTGGIAHLHAKQMLAEKNVEIEAIADPSAHNRELFLKTFNLLEVEQFSDHQEMLENSALDAVIICSPHTLHKQHVVDALEHQCHVLVEKPMACSVEESTLLIDLAKEKGKILQVSYQRHFEPAFLYIRNAISDGVIGKLTSVSANLYQEWGHLSKNTWRQNPDLSGGGMLMDSGSHIIDVLLWTTGLKPLEIKSTIETHGRSVELDSISTIRFENNVIAGLTIIGNAPSWHETYVFCGEQGAIFFDNGKLWIRKLGEEPILPVLPEQTTNSDQSFIRSILGEHEVMVPGDFAKEVVGLTEKIYQSSGYQPHSAQKEGSL